MVHPSRAALSVRRLVGALPCLLAVACIGGQSTDDVITSKPSQRCLPDRIPVVEVSSALQRALDRLEGSYEIGGRWGTPTALVGFAPADIAFRGQLEIKRASGPVIRLSGCGYDGVEAPVRVSLRTEEGALDETVSGSALLQDLGNETVDGSPPPFRTRVSARFDMRALAGTFRAEDSEEWSLDAGTLSIEVTPFGTRGSLNASITSQAPKNGSRAVLPSGPSVLTWPVDEGCGSALGDEGSAFYPADTAESRALHEALEGVARESFQARYEDGTSTMVSVRIEPPTAICGDGGQIRLRTTAHMKTADGRIDVSLAVFLEPAFALLHFNQRTDIAWTFAPEQLAQRVGHIAADLTGFAQVGIEAWFDRTPEPAGWFKVIGHRAGDCLHCDAEGGCLECAWDRRVTLLALYIGAQATRARP